MQGVPKDFTSEGTLRACLGEIDRCYSENVMPFFVNMTRCLPSCLPVCLSVCLSACLPVFLAAFCSELAQQTRNLVLPFITYWLVYRVLVCVFVCVSVSVWAGCLLTQRSPRQSRAHTSGLKVSQLLRWRLCMVLIAKIIRTVHFVYCCVRYVCVCCFGTRED